MANGLDVLMGRGPLVKAEDAGGLAARVVAHLEQHHDGHAMDDEGDRAKVAASVSAKFGVEHSKVAAMLGGAHSGRSFDDAGDRHAFAHDFAAKHGGAGAAPVVAGAGGGWMPIPGGHSNGKRRPKAGGGFEYQYSAGADHIQHLADKMGSALARGKGDVDVSHIPHHDDAKAMVDAAHAHAMKGPKEKKEVQAALRNAQDVSRDVSNKAVRGWEQYGKAALDPVGMARAVRDHVSEALSKLATKAKPKEAPKFEAPAGEAPEGKHHVAQGGGAKEVDTIARHGLYAVHGSAGESGLRAGNSYTVTHTPTGMAAHHDKTKAGAIAFAKHMHEYAGDAGKDAKFGEHPNEASMKRLAAGNNAFQRTRKSQAIDPSDRLMKALDLLCERTSAYSGQIAKGGEVAKVRTSLDTLTDRTPAPPKVVRMGSVDYVIAKHVDPSYATGRRGITPRQTVSDVEVGPQASMLDGIRYGNGLLTHPNGVNRRG